MVRVTVPANIILTIPNINLKVPKDSTKTDNEVREAILRFETAINEINYVDTDRKISFRVHITDIPQEVV